MKTKADVTQFIDSLESFISAVHENRASHAIEDAVRLNRQRDELTATIEQIYGLEEKPIPTDSFPCPVCGGEMILRTRRSDGNKFWGCKKYPNCNGTRDSDGLSREEREAERQKITVQQEAGFKFRKV